MATSYDLNITQGSEFFVTFNLSDSAGSPIDLNQYQLRARAKHRYGDTGTLVNLSPYTGVPTSGIVNLKVLAADTAALPVCQGFYNLELYSGTYAENIIEGKIEVYPEATTTDT